MIGAQNMRKALLRGFLEPNAEIIAAENKWDLTGRLALQEQAKSLPWTAVWDHYCERNSIPGTMECLAQIREYEQQVQFKR